MEEGTVTVLAVIHGVVVIVGLAFLFANIRRIKGAWMRLIKGGEDE